MRTGRRSGFRYAAGPVAVAVITATLIPTAVGTAQESQLRVTGVVRDTAGAPIESVLVWIDTLATVFSDRSGDFDVTLPGAGTHILHLRKLGFAPRNLRFTLGADSGDIDAGLVTLGPGDHPVLHLRGFVRHAVTGQAVVAVAVGLNAETRAVTDMSGAFQFSTSDLRWGTNLVEVRRIGFEPVADAVWLDEPETTFELTIQLRPLPVELAEVIVEGDRTIIAFGRLAEFYRRRREGLGRYITSADIERRRPFYISDMLRQVPGFVVSYGPDGRPTFRSRRSYDGFRGSCRPVVFLDGMRLAQSPWLSVDLDDVVIPDHVAGMEVYTGPAQLPPQFNTFGSECGVIVVWTK